MFASVLNDEFKQFAFTSFSDGQRDGPVRSGVVAMSDDITERLVDREADAAGFCMVVSQAGTECVNHLADDGEVVWATVELDSQIMRSAFFYIGEGEP